jgi:hypothetical protein
MGETWSFVFYVGTDGVTKIDWGQARGNGGYLDTVRVWRDERLWREFPFCNCIGVEYARATQAPGGEVES